MALQLILGSSGAGKSEYIYEDIIRQTMQDERKNMIVLVPEQYSLEIQRKLVEKHPRGGSFQIDVIGFNRLAYRIFDELHIKPQKVLEDFGKSMLLRKAAQEKKDQLSLYAGSLDKAGFIDEAKSLMSEVYQYDISRERLAEALRSLGDTGEDKVLSEKLRDMLLIFATFEEKKGNAFIVAEQMLELLTAAAEKSQLIAESEIILDGFTGFTPIQLNLISVLLRRAKKVTIVLTMDVAAYAKKHIGEHELFALTRQTIDQLLLTAEKAHVVAADTIFIGKDGCRRWEKGHPLAHLEQNLFRYPYHTGTDDKQAIRIISYDNPAQEVTGVAEQIRCLVMDQGYRYRDIAVVSGNLEETADFVQRIFPLYDIPYFIDMTMPVKNHPCVDALTHAFRIVEENFSYDSVFAFLKSGVMKDLEQEEIEALENYVLARGKKGIRSWSQAFKDGEDTTMEELRQVVMEVLGPFYKACSGKKKTVSQMVEAVYVLMDMLSMEHRFEDDGLYEKICQIFDKMVEIMPEDDIEIAELEELFAVGMKDVSLGVIPPTLDMLVVGDIIRTRLDDIRALFIVGVNDGVIPKRAKRSQIINDREKERLLEFGIHMAPTERVNSFTEHFYLYQNMTKPKDLLYLSYVNMSASNETMRPSYILDRIHRIFPDLKEQHGNSLTNRIVTRQAGFETLIIGIRELLAGNHIHESETLQLYKLYLKNRDTSRIESMLAAMRYQNLPEPLAEDVAKLVQIQRMAMSVSKLEQYASCAYAFFLKYILHLEERQIAKIDNRNVGMILHGAMEQMFCYVRDQMGNQWDKVGDALRDQKIEEFVRENFNKEYEGQEIDNGQYVVLEKSLIRIGKRTVKKLQSMMDDAYQPVYFEYAFKKKLTVGKETMTLAGIVDRGDLYVDKDNQTIGLRVIDYKSGAHDFDIGQLYEGLELQLAIYTDVMREMVDQEWNQNREKEDQYQINTESMYYYHMQDPYVEADSVAQAEELREKKLGYKGMQREEDDEFETVLSYAEYKAVDLAAQIKKGVIDKNPKQDTNGKACEYCAYKDVCRFDEKYGKNRYHNTKHSAKDTQQLLEEMRNVCRGQKNKIK